MSAEPEDDLLAEHEVSLEEKRWCMAWWVMTGSEGPPQESLLIGWQKSLFRRIETALRLWETRK